MDEPRVLAIATACRHAMLGMHQGAEITNKIEAAYPQLAPKLRAIQFIAAKQLTDQIARLGSEQ